MENDYPITDRLSLCAEQVRLIAGLMLTSTGLQEIESDAFALMLQDLAERLECLTGETAHCLTCASHTAEEGRP